MDEKLDCIYYILFLNRNYTLYVDLFSALNNWSTMSRVFANGPGDRGSIPGRVILDSKNATWYCLA